MQDYYEGYNSNVHRGVHTLAALATDAYEASREKVSNFINSPSSRQLIYTRNASEAINLVSYSWGAENLHRGDEVMLLSFYFPTLLIFNFISCLRTSF